MTRAHLVSRGFFGCLLVAACADAGPGGQAGVTVRDSAGIEIVEHAGNIWSAREAWRVSAEPVLSIGVAEGEDPYLLDGVAGIVALGDGRLVVANSGDQTLRWFDANGAFLFQRGGAGEGPGEFSRLGRITLGTADTIIAVDWTGRRIVSFAPDGALGKTRRFEGLAAPPGPVYSLADGSLVMGASGFSTTQLGERTEPGVMRLPSPLLRLAADGSAVDTVGMFPGMEVEVRETARGFTIGAPHFAKSFTYAADRIRIYVGTADRFVIDELAPDGQLMRSTRALDTDLSIAPDSRDAYLESLRARVAELPPEARPDAERELAEMKLPETAPAYSAFLVDADGHLWVAGFGILSSMVTRWLVFDPEGRIVTLVTVPAGFRLMAATHDRLIGRATDDLGVEHVVAYAIER